MSVFFFRFLRLLFYSCFFFFIFFLLLGWIATCQLRLKFTKFCTQELYFIFLKGIKGMVFFFFLVGFKRNAIIVWFKTVRNIHIAVAATGNLYNSIYLYIFWGQVFGFFIIGFNSNKWLYDFFFSSASFFFLFVYRGIWKHTKRLNMISIYIL